MVSSLKLTRIDSSLVNDIALYKFIVGALQYATTMCPDLSFVVNHVCQFMSFPLEEQWKAMKRILHYLVGTLHHGLVLSQSTFLQLVGFCDVDWANDFNDRRSTSDRCVFLGSNLASSKSKKQQVVAHSSIEAKHRNLAHIIAKILWL